MKLGRNDPCPCGSGAKVKRCCGVDSARRRARLAADAAAELLDLALHFPRQRPATAAFDAWARTAPAEPCDEEIALGLAAIDDDERERIVGSFARAYPDVWNGMLADFGNDELAVEIVLIGAVVAGVLERLPLPDAGLAWIESGPEIDAATALAAVLSPGDLWSVIESGKVAVALDEVPEYLDDEEYDALERECESRLTAWHQERIDVLLDRVRERLSVDRFPRASLVLRDAVDRLDAAGRRTLAVELLAGSLDRVYDAEERLAA